MQTSYFSTPHGFKRKRRPAKPSEVKQQQQNSVWHVGNKPRTAKHKQRSVCNAAKSYSLQTTKSGRKRWTPDSGATVSCTSDMSILETITEINPGRRVQVANKQLVDVELVGTARISLTDADGKPYEILVDNVLYSPDFSENLLSVEELYRQHKITTTFRGRHAEFRTPDGVVIPFAADERRRYQLCANSAKARDDPWLWHRRFCHAGTTALKRMGQHIPCLRDPNLDFSKCDACLQGGGRKLPLSARVKRGWDSSDKDRRRKRDDARAAAGGSSAHWSEAFDGADIPRGLCGRVENGRVCRLKNGHDLSCVFD